MNENILKDDLKMRLNKFGAKSLSVMELLSMITNIKLGDLNAFKYLNNLNELTNYMVADLVNEFKLTEDSAIKIASAIEFGRRVLSSSGVKKTKYHSAYDIYELLYLEMLNLDKEELWLIYIDAKLNIINYEMIYSGLITTVLFDPKIIFQKVIANHARGFIMVHNHPSGDTTPSYQDIEATYKIKEASKLLNLTLIDHLIIGRQEFYSILKREKSYQKKGLI